VAGPGWRDPHSLETVSKPLSLKIYKLLRVTYSFLVARSYGPAHRAQSLNPPWRGVWGVISPLCGDKRRRGPIIRVGILAC
jgi:hypothetical protein